MSNINFSDFQKMDLRVGEIKNVDEIPGADKIYRLIVDLGGEERALVAGIKQHYKPEDLPGKKVLVLANLEPKTIRGVASHGMILCAHSEDRSRLVLTTVASDVAAGAKVS